MRDRKWAATSCRNRQQTTNNNNSISCESNRIAKAEAAAARVKAQDPLLTPLCSLLFSSWFALSRIRWRERSCWSSYNKYWYWSSIEFASKQQQRRICRCYFTWQIYLAKKWLFAFLLLEVSLLAFCSPQCQTDSWSASRAWFVCISLLYSFFFILPPLFRPSKGRKIFVRKPYFEWDENRPKWRDWEAFGSKSFRQTSKQKTPELSWTEKSANCVSIFPPNIQIYIYIYVRSPQYTADIILGQ